MKVLALDIGNTTLSWAAFDAEGHRDAAGVRRLSHSLGEADFLDHLRVQLAPQVSADCKTALASVRHGLTQAVAKILTELGAPPPRIINAPDQVPVPNRTTTPHSVGVDRLLNALAASSRFAGQRVVVVDVGSAVTVDLVSEEGEFLGGSIAPGLRLCARALHTFAPALPEVSVGNFPPVPATNTEEAIQSGIFHQVLGGIERQISHHWNQAKALVVLTGGDMPLIASGLKLPHGSLFLVDDLTLQGIRLCALSDE